jgi:hypothetical protein
MKYQAGSKKAYLAVPPPQVYVPHKPPTHSAPVTSDMILGQLNQRKLDVNQSAINSAALQDHIMKSFNLNNMDPFRKLPPRKPMVVK